MAVAEALTGEVVEGGRGKRWLSTLRRFGAEKPLGAVGGLTFLALTVVAVLAPQLAPMDPIETNLPARFSPLSLAHPFGSDDIGRDLLSRTIYGARISLYVAIVSTLLGTVIGALLGLISGYTGGWLDLFLQRLMDMLLALPGLILALAILVAVGPGLNGMTIAIAVAWIPQTNRVVRSAALAIKETEYVRAARSIGCSRWRIMFLHVGPGCVAPYLVHTTALLGVGVLFEASLSFLGLGVPPPTPSWGRMLLDAMPFMSRAPWLAIFPGLMLSLTVLGINLFGDAMRDFLDPRLQTL